MIPGRPRTAFTLLEMLLATGVSVLLMAALYVAMDIQLKHAGVARDVVEQSALARALLDRIAVDIRHSTVQVAPTTLASSSSSPSSGGQSGTPGSSGNASAAAGGQAAGGFGAGQQSSTSPSSQSTAGMSSPIEFNLSLQGDVSRLKLAISRFPRELNYERAQPLSDLRVVTYWMATDAGRPIGLARREMRQPTVDPSLTALPTSGSGDAAFVIAEEVKSISFRYFDGLAMKSTWDGTQTGDDLLTPTGPPVAVEVTLGFVFPNSEYPNVQGKVQSYRRVVTIPSGDGLQQ
jgi:hypothetical protein